MKTWLSYTFLVLCALISASAWAEEGLEEKDYFSDTPHIERPKDFEAFKQLAKQNRLERIDRLNEVMSCFQQAKAMEDIFACQEMDAHGLAKMRLAYCETGVSWIQLEKPRRNAKEQNAEKGLFDRNECEKAQMAIDNIRAKLKSEQRVAQPTAAPSAPPEQTQPAPPAPDQPVAAPAHEPAPQPQPAH